MSIVCEHARWFTTVHASKIYSNKSYVVYLFCILFVCYVLLVCEYGSEQNAAKQIYSQFITYVVRCIIIAHGHHMLHMIYCVGSRNGINITNTDTSVMFFPSCRTAVLHVYVFWKFSSFAKRYCKVPLTKPATTHGTTIESPVILAMTL